MKKEEGMAKVDKTIPGISEEERRLKLRGALVVDKRGNVRKKPRNKTRRGS